MQRTFYYQRFLAALLFAAASACTALAEHSAIEPVPRGDQWWKDRQASFNKRVGELGEKAEVIFIGDSITQGWEGEGKEAWEEAFSHHHPINLGIGGDRTQHVLWRLENGNLEGLNPKAAVVMIGTNNSNGEDNTVEQISEGVRAIVEKLREALPSTQVVLVAIFPRGENPNPQRGKINQINQIIRKLADDESVHWLDIGHEFVDEKGRIPKEIMPDYLHLSKEGYEMWASLLEEVLDPILHPEEEAGEEEEGAETAEAEDAAAKLAGEWIATLPGPNNEPVDLAFTIDSAGEDGIKGRFHAGRDLEIQEGHFHGDEFHWTVKRDRPGGGTMSYSMTGQLEEGKIKGTAVTSFEENEVKIEWSARRK